MGFPSYAELIDAEVDTLLQDDVPLRAACDEVAMLDRYSAALIADFHGALIGHPDDRPARALRLLDAIEAKVRHALRDEALARLRVRERQERTARDEAAADSRYMAGLRADDAEAA